MSFRHWTQEGRVVYDRVRHPFSERDLIRIELSLIRHYSPDTFSIQKILASVSTGLLRSILDLVGAGRLADIVYWLVINFLDEAFRLLGEGFAKAFSLFMVRHVSLYLPTEVQNTLDRLPTV